MGPKRIAAAVVASAMCCIATKAYCQGAPAASVAAPTAAPADSAVKNELQRGYSYKNRKLSAQAIAAFEAVLKKDPDNHDATTELGYLQAGLRHYDLEAKYLSAAAAQEPSNMRIHMDLAYAYLNLKQQPEALEQVKIVAANKSEFQEGALKQLGFMNLAGGDRAAAAENFAAVVALDPKDFSSALQLGYTYTILKKEDEARKAFSAALASNDEKIHDAAEAALQSTGGISAPASPVGASE